MLKDGTGSDDGTTTLVGRSGVAWTAGPMGETGPRRLGQGAPGGASAQLRGQEGRLDEPRPWHPGSEVAV